MKKAQWGKKSKQATFSQGKVDKCQTPRTADQLPLPAAKEGSETQPAEKNTSPTQKEFETELKNKMREVELQIEAMRGVQTEVQGAQNDTKSTPPNPEDFKEVETHFETCDGDGVGRMTPMQGAQLTSGGNKSYP